MSFPLDVLVSGIAIANDLTKGVQASVVIEPWESQATDGTITYGDPVTYSAVVDTTRKQKVGVGGELLIIGATVTIIGDVTPNGATGRIEPIDPRDRVTLPDGRVAPIVSVPNSVVNPATNRGLIHEIELGAL